LLQAERVIMKGLFKNIFKGSVSTEKKEVNIDWIPLTENTQLNAIITKSKTKTVAIFKHSTRCGISRMALKDFEREFDFPKNTIALYFLDLLKYRELSKEISAKFDVPHQSPQILVIKQGKVIYTDSHYSISIATLKEALATH